MNKKELPIKTNLLISIMISIFLSIVTIFSIQHFGEINGGYSQNWGHYSFIENGKLGLRYEFTNPINGNKYYNDYIIGEQIDKKGILKYSMKAYDFYIPSLLGNFKHIILLSLIYGLLIWFFNTYKLKFV